MVQLRPAHPSLATHDTLGLATQAELDTHAAAADPHTGYRLETADHSHQTTGAQAGTLAEAALALTDITTGNVSTTAHGFVPKAPNVATQFLDGTGAWSTPAGGAGAVTREGGTQTEATTTSTTAVDLITITVSSAVGDPISAFVDMYKTVGGATVGRVGLKLNATEVLAPVQWAGSGAETGLAKFNLIYGRTGYLRAGTMLRAGSVSGGAINVLGADMPTAALTSFIVEASVGGTATMGVQDVQVYSHAVA